MLGQRLKSLLLTRLAVRRNVQLKPGFHVGPGSVISAPRALAIGTDVYVGKNVTIEVDGEIGDGVLIANSVGIVGRRDHDIHDVGVNVRQSRWVGDFPTDLSLKTVIGSDVWIGYGAVVLSGISIGDSSVVAAGSVVTSDIPPNSIVAGNPATFVRRRFSEEELERHWTRLKETGNRLLIGQVGAAE